MFWLFTVAVCYLSSIVVHLTGTTNSVAESCNQQHIELNNLVSTDPVVAVQDKWMVDGAGRVRLFHGFNSVMKGFPWYSSDLLNATHLDLYQQQYGFNVVRLGIMWSGLEPKQSVYNDSYIAVMKKIVSQLKDRDMYVILDLHQDVLSSRFDMYDGVPLWVLDKLPKPRYPYPWPLTWRPHGLNWAQGYFSEAVCEAFQGIYNNTAGVLELLMTFWVKVAEEFKAFDNVLGYELMNEPWAGDVYTDLSLLEPGHAGRRNLMPMYDRVEYAIRQVDTKKLIFYEPVTWGLLFNGNKTGTGFDHVPGGDMKANTSVLSYHYYCYIIETKPSNRTYGLLEKFACDAVIGPTVFSTVEAEIARLGGGAFLTEFGLCIPDGKSTSVNTIECEYVLNQADRHLHSWAYWDAAFFYSNGTVNKEVLQVFARPFAKQTAGVPQDMQFIAKPLRHFRYTYMLDPNIKGSTVIFIPQVHYPLGVDVDIATTLSVKWTFRNHHLTVTYTGQHVHVTPQLCTVDVYPVV